MRLWLVLEIACISNHTSVHTSRRSLWNIMNDREMNKSRPLFPKCFQATDLKGIGHYPLKVENCKMVAGIRCFGTGGRALWNEGTGRVSSLTSVMMLNLKKNVWESCRPRRWKVLQEKKFWACAQARGWKSKTYTVNCRKLAQLKSRLPRWSDTKRWDGWGRSDQPWGKPSLHGQSYENQVMKSGDY